MPSTNLTVDGATKVNLHAFNEAVHAKVVDSGSSTWFYIWGGDDSISSRNSQHLAVFTDHANIANVVHGLLSHPEVKAAYLELLEQTA